MGPRDAIKIFLSYARLQRPSDAQQVKPGKAD
jgi:hypothetical protein